MHEVIVDLIERNVSVDGEIISLDRVSLWGSQVGWSGLALLAQNANRISTDMIARPRTEAATQLALLEDGEDGSECPARRPPVVTGVVLAGNLERYHDVARAALEARGYTRDDAHSEAYMLATKFAAAYPNYAEWDAPAVGAMARTMVWQMSGKLARKASAERRAEVVWSERLLGDDEYFQKNH